MPEKCRFLVGVETKHFTGSRGAKLSAFEQLKANSMFDWLRQTSTINYQWTDGAAELYEPHTVK